jgi:hypothetical protein
MKRYLVKAGRNVVLANGNPDDVKAFDGGKEKSLKTLQESSDEDVINNTSTPYGPWYTL